MIADKKEKYCKILYVKYFFEKNYTFTPNFAKIGD